MPVTPSLDTSSRAVGAAGADGRGIDPGCRRLAGAARVLAGRARAVEAAAQRGHAGRESPAFGRDAGTVRGDVRPGGRRTKGAARREPSRGRSSRVGRRRTGTRRCGAHAGFVADDRPPRLQPHRCLRCGDRCVRAGRADRWARQAAERLPDLPGHPSRGGDHRERTDPAGPADRLRRRVPERVREQEPRPAVRLHRPHPRSRTRDIPPRRPWWTSSRAPERPRRRSSPT